VQFRDTVVIVTGAASGINRAIALKFAQAEAVVVIADVNAAGAEETASQVRAAGGRAIVAQTDVRRRNEIDAMVKVAVEPFGRIDVLVNGAGVETLIPFLDLTEDEWNRVLGVNLTGAFLCGQAVAREMVRAGRGGKIINIASINSAIALPNQAHYVASKGGLLMLTKAMALELAAHRINVNAIGPGVVDTPLTAKSLSDPVRRDSLLRNTPLGRFGRPSDIAEAAAFLASEAAGFITGTILYVDGGWMIT
jgi:glucose 1-dehydrogenase